MKRKKLAAPEVLASVVVDRCYRGEYTYAQARSKLMRLLHGRATLYWAMVDLVCAYELRQQKEAAQ